MASLRAWLLKPIVKQLGKQFIEAETPGDIRTVYRRWSRGFPIPRGLDVATVMLGQRKARVLTPRQTSGAKLLYLHGGAYVFGTVEGYGGLCARLAMRGGFTTYALDYRLAPEHPYPAALEDAYAAYMALLEQTGAAQIVLAGDSAGGGLSLALLHKLRDEGVALPAACALICPWVDLTNSGDSHHLNAHRELVIPHPLPQRAAAWYAGGTMLNTPGLSPLFGDQSGLPPLFIQACRDEILYSDATRLAQAVEKAGGNALLEVYDGLWHDWHLLAPFIPEAGRAITAIVQFLKARLDLAQKAA